MQKVSHEIGLPIGCNAKLGLIVLQSDETIEYEFWELISGLNLALHVSRISSNASWTDVHGRYCSRSLYRRRNNSGW